MPKIPMSRMTESDFLTILGALNMTQRELAVALSRSLSVVNAYATGRLGIPASVANQLTQLCEKRARDLESVVGRLIPASDTGALLVATNTINERSGKPSRKPQKLTGKVLDQHPYPPYRLTPRKLLVLAQALAAYREHTRKRAQSCGDAQLLSTLKLELADVDVLIDNVRGLKNKGAPYDFLIVRQEWPVISRALRHLYAWAKHAPVCDNGSAERLRQNGIYAYGFYQHWRRNRGAGWPRKR